MHIKIARGSHNNNSITGELFVDGKFVCHTLELPWKNNQSYVSSIPEGNYPATIRYDKPDKWRIQLDKVPNRTVVQIHTGNFPSQIEGCVLIGNSVRNSTNSIHDSGLAYAGLKRSFYGTDMPVATPDTNLEVTVQFPVRRTEYIYNGNSLLSYEDNGNWRFSLLGFEAMTETSRSLEHIFMSGTVGGEKSFLRVPLWGGVLATAPNASGPWDVSEGFNVTRKD